MNLPIQPTVLANDSLYDLRDVQDILVLLGMALAVIASTNTVVMPLPLP